MLPVITRITDRYMRRWHLLTMLLCLVYALPAAAQHFSFNKISQNADKEFASLLNSITEDSRGYLWIGTRTGLGRYDGATLKKYLADKTNPHAIPGDDIYDVLEDPDHDLWVLTVRGVARLDPQNDQFYPITNEEGQNVKAYAACIWRDGLLLGDGHAIHYYNKKENTFTQLAELPLSAWMERFRLLDDRTLLCMVRSNRVWIVHLDTGEVDGETLNVQAYPTDFLIDRQHRIWITTLGNGLVCLSAEGKLLTHFNTENSDFITNRLKSLTECNGYIVAAAQYHGVVVVHPETRQVWRFEHEKGGGQFTLPGNEVNLVRTDKYGNILLGIIGHGLVSFDKVYLRTYTNLYAGFRKGPSGESIASLLSYGDKLWVGTTDSGLNLFDPTDNTFTPIPSTEGMHIFSMCDLAPGKLLLSVLNEGLYIFDIATGRLTPLMLMSPSDNYDAFLRGNGAYVWRNSPETLLVIASHLYVYHIKEGVFTRVEEKEDHMIYNGTLKMVCSLDNESYLTDRCRLYRYDHRTGDLSILYRTPNNELVIHIATRSQDGLFWLGTNDGLYTFDLETQATTRIETRYFQSIMSLFAGPFGQIWIGTYYALFSYESTSRHFIAYDVTEGALPNEYSRTVTCMDNQYIYMGGTKGLLQIAYKHARPANEKPVFAISDCTLNGETKGNPFLDQQQEVELPYNCNFSLRMMTEEKNRFRQRTYRFHIPNYSSEIIETITPELKLYGLRAGHYTIEAACTLIDGSWSDFQPIGEFQVLPPWYRSNLFLSCMGLLVLLTGGAGLWVLLVRKQLVMERTIEQNRRQLNEEKVDFLVNVSHELRTPLTLIYAPLNRILGEIAPSDKYYRPLLTACRQASRMTNIINMVLDLEKMEHKSVQLQVQAHPFNAWVEEGMRDFISEGRERSVNVDFVPDERIQNVDFDINKCDIVLNNLLINALKHSPKNTTITVRTQLADNGETVKVSISDQGTGLQKGEIQELFTRFHQGSKESTGTGLGLAYSKVLLEQHKGSIEAYNNPDRGATFFFTLPVRQSEAVIEAAVSKEQIKKIVSYRPAKKKEEPRSAHQPADIPAAAPAPSSASAPAPATATTPSPAPAPSSAPGASTPPPAATASPFTLLVVDDQEDITSFLAESLQGDFQQVLTAKDGIEALKVLRGNRPDVVISDVMMPRMNGFDLCREIKGDINISHIPVILLTAKTDEQSVLTGYKTGADAYIPKPFDLQVLKQIAFNLLNARQRIQGKYSTPGAVPLPEEATISYADEAFLTKLNKVIEEHINNTDLGIGLLESEMAMSRASLFNKMKLLTGMGANEYITKIRLEKALQLVKGSTLSFTEISERVGYSSSSYFSSAFKQYTGMTPTQYRKANTQK
ncbi:MAG: response regulator [Bacteroidales bacterium]|nr:response regulator [Bacteroidales bacterium]